MPKLGNMLTLRESMAPYIDFQFDKVLISDPGLWVPCPRLRGHVGHGKFLYGRTPSKTRKVYDNGDAHFLTFSCFHRLPLLSKKRACEWMVEAIKLSRQTNPYDLWAWVIMPEHVHLVLLPHKKVKVASILTTMKQSVSRRAINWLRKNSPEYLSKLLDVQPNGKSSYRFWQRGGGYDRNLRSARDVHEKVMYVHQNPVKRGLVDSPEKWDWSSAQSWIDGTDKPISLDRDSVPTLTIVDDRVETKLFE